MSLYTRWACFHCRKSFAKDASETPRKCPDCAKEMIDMGAFFEPPRKLNKKRWAVMKVLADYGYKFRSEGSKAYIKAFILQAKNPRVADVIERIELEKQRKINTGEF
jgi:DNA-directed RNA polymerase subunit RPC12/RpoP